MKRLLCGSLVAPICMAAVLLGASDARAQFPKENHFKVYQATENPQVIYRSGVTLIDQWGTSEHSELRLEYFANPAEKIHNETRSPILDPQLHHTWWRIQQQPLEPRGITVLNQFGFQEWTVGDAQYLILPALKNPGEGEQIPKANHYKCYDATGPPPNVTITLTDQFYGKVFVVGAPLFFCNPAEKIVSLQTFPIVNEEAHLACYRITPVQSPRISVLALDQFGKRDLLIEDEFVVCVPSFKNPTVPVEESTWGHMKVLFRD